MNKTLLVFLCLFFSVSIFAADNATVTAKGCTKSKTCVNQEWTGRYYKCVKDSDCEGTAHSWNYVTVK